MKKNYLAKDLIILSILLIQVLYLAISFNKIKNIKEEMTKKEKETWVILDRYNKSKEHIFVYRDQSNNVFCEKVNLSKYYQDHNIGDTVSVSITKADKISLLKSGRIGTYSVIIDYNKPFSIICMIVDFIIVIVYSLITLSGVNTLIGEKREKYLLPTIISWIALIIPLVIIFV